MVISHNYLANYVLLPAETLFFLTYINIKCVCVHVYEKCCIQSSSKKPPLLSFLLHSRLFCNDHVNNKEQETVIRCLAFLYLTKNTDLKSFSTTTNNHHFSCEELVVLFLIRY